MAVIVGHPRRLAQLPEAAVVSHRFDAFPHREFAEVVLTLDLLPSTELLGHGLPSSQFIQLGFPGHNLGSGFDTSFVGNGFTVRRA